MLPDHATPTSQRLANLASTIAAQAPDDVTEIILEGSTARGIADQFSDIELQFFSDSVPSTQDILTWMNRIGFTGDVLIRKDEQDSKLVDQLYDNVTVELHWTSFAYEAQLLDEIMERIGGSQFINEPYKWMDAIPLRAGEHITQWKALFETYPDSVRDRYIQAALDDWRATLHDPIDVLGNWKDAYRNAWFYLTKMHWMNVLPLLRILFAYNRMWEPVAKWWHTTESKLIHKPNTLVERINDVLSNPDALARIDQFSRLQIETLQIIQDEYVVGELLEKFIAVREYGRRVYRRKP